MKTVLITGSSSGYGLETARYFHDRGWNVVATMRRPNPSLLPASNRIKLVALDVTDAGSIARAIAEAGPIDVLVNNAGIGVVGAFEATSMQTVRDVFEANTFGTMAMVQAVIPQMRKRLAGTIVNVTSSVTLASMPLAAAYTGSKTAVEGFTGSLAHEALRAAPDAAAPAGLLRGLADERLALSIREMHRDPSRAWTVEQLAKVAALSRSAYFQRFTRAIGMPPMEYLLAWRMAIAKDILDRQDLGIEKVAERVGYSSASTFSTAFTRYVGRSPGGYARERRRMRSRAA